MLIAIASSIGLCRREMLNTSVLTMDYGKKMAVMHEVGNRLGEPLAVFPMMSGHPGNSKNNPHVYCLIYGNLLAVAVDVLGYQRCELPCSGNIKVGIVDKIVVLKI